MSHLLVLSQSVPDAPGLQLHWIDWTGLALLGGFALLGLLRGLWWQVVRLVGLVASAALARTFSGAGAEHLREWTSWSPEIAQGVAWIGIFVAGLLVTALVGTLGKKSLEAMQLGLVDRAGGAAVGLATGALLHVAGLLALAHLGPQPWTEETLAGTHSRGLLQLVTTRYPVLLREEPAETGALLQWLAAPGSPAGSATSAADADEAPRVR
jgi:uncharacterized membrane protein required for colicin V production